MVKGLGPLLMLPRVLGCMQTVQQCQRLAPIYHTILSSEYAKRQNVPLLGRSHGIGLLAVQMVVPGSGSDRSDGGSGRGRGQVEGRAGILSSGCRGSSSLGKQSVHGLETT